MAPYSGGGSGILQYDAGPIIPADRTTTWQPGVTYNTVPGISTPGIPNYTNIYTTLSPIGGGADDTTQIRNAIDAAGAIASASSPQVVKLTTGLFYINGNGLNFRQSYVVLRGSGPGDGVTNTGVNAVDPGDGHGPGPVVDSTATQLWKADRATNLNYECIQLGQDPIMDTNFIDLQQDALRGSFTCVLASNPGIVVGEIVRIDHLTDNDPDVFWGERHNPAGIYITGSVSGTTLTVTAIVSGTVQVGHGLSGVGLPYPNGIPEIQSQLTGPAGGLGTYSISNPPGTISSRTMFLGFPTRRFFSRQDRSISQLMEVTHVSGTTLTFSTPFRHNHPVSMQAQCIRYVNAFQVGSGIEDLFIYGGMGGDGHGNLAVGLCSYCWFKHIESAWSKGTSVGFYNTFRCELRDSFVHEGPNPNPGGDGYLVGFNGSSDCLAENCIMWYGDKVDVFRGSSGGNVVAYCYMDDAFGATFPNSPEAGVNAGHYTTPHMELLEGNYSHNFKGDSFWGASIDITVFRNHLSAIRAAHGPLATYSFTTGGTTYPYGDYEGRVACDIQAGSYRNNIVGNVLGKSGQVLLSHSGGNYNVSQDRFQFEYLGPTYSVAPNPVLMYFIGADQSHQGIDGNWAWVADTYTTILRDGNWDFVSNSQKWLGIGGTVSDPRGTPKSIPNSLYLTSKPAFFGSNPWPWVNPSTGAVTTLPAKARFDAGTPNTL